VELGIRWARAFNALLVGLGVVDQPGICRPEPTGIGGSSLKKHRDANQLADASRRVDEFLQQFVARCPADVVCRSIKAVGHPHEQIVLEAERFDVILLGQRPQFHFETQDRDSDTVRKVVLNSPHPVVIVPQQLPVGETVLVAYDGSPAAARALQAFAACGLGEGKEVHVISVQSERQVAERRLERAVEYLRLHDLPARPRAVATQAKPAQVLLENSQPGAVGLVVMGASSWSRLREFLRGSTTRALLRDSAVPIFLCR
jgi:nucleotide-binding universal stress UspA family protein